MTRMVELVIKIPEKWFNDMVKEEFEDVDELCAVIQHGTQLPKGHGKLIDIGRCDRKLFYQQCGGANSLITVKTAFDMLLSLSTIIEADKAESEDKV